MKEGPANTHHGFSAIWATSGTLSARVLMDLPFDQWQEPRIFDGRCTVPQSGQVRVVGIECNEVGHTLLADKHRRVPSLVLGPNEERSAQAVEEELAA